MFKNNSSSSSFDIITQKVHLKEIVLTPHELIWKSKFPLTLNIKIFTLWNT